MNKKLINIMTLSCYEAKIMALKKIFDTDSIDINTISVEEIVALLKKKNVTKQAALDECMKMFELIFQINKSIGQQLMIKLYAYSQNLFTHSIWDAIENFLFEFPLSTTIEYLEDMTLKNNDPSLTNLYTYLKREVENSLNTNMRKL